MNQKLPESDVEHLRQMLENNQTDQIDEVFQKLDSQDHAWLLDHLTGEVRQRLLEILGQEEAADVLEELDNAQRAEVVEYLQAEVAAPILQAMTSDDRADVLGEITPENRESILREMDAEPAQATRGLMSYPSDTAGGLMITEYLSYRQTLTVGDVLADLQANAAEYSDYDVQYTYIVDQEKRLAGVLRMRDLLFSAKDKPIARIMITSPRSVGVHTALDDLRTFFEDHPFFGVPVVDDTGLLLGVLRRTAVEEEVAARANRFFLRVSGIIGGEELRSMPLKVRSGRRLSWLSMNIVLNIIAASVIAFYQDTLAQVIALAVFLPIISDMSGCSGNQAVAVSIRELTLGIVKPRDFFRTLLKEAAVGLINGVCLGLLIGLVAFLWKGNAVLGLVVGAALAVNTLVAVCFGGLVPLMLRKLKIDPALVSGPMLTTVTDMCGFFLALTFATIALPYLT
jgi:magnesium transporter